MILIPKELKEYIVYDEDNKIILKDVPKELESIADKFKKMLDKAYDPNDLAEY